MYLLSGRAGWENIWLEVTESQIFSHPARTNLVDKYFMI